MSRHEPGEEHHPRVNLSPGIRELGHPRSRLSLKAVHRDQGIGSVVLGQNGRPNLKLAITPNTEPSQEAALRRPYSRNTYIPPERLKTLITQGHQPGKLACRLACQLNLLLLSNQDFTPAAAENVRDLLMRDPNYVDHWGESSTLPGYFVWNGSAATTADHTESLLGMSHGVLKIAAMAPGNESGATSNVANLLNDRYAIMAETETHARVLFDIDTERTCVFDPLTGNAALYNQADAISSFFHDSEYVTYA